MKLLYLTLKDLRLVARDRSALISLLLVPIVVIVVVAETQSGGGSQSIVFPVVNEDQGPVANALIKVFRQHLDVREVLRQQVDPRTSSSRSTAFLVETEFCPTRARRIHVLGQR